jgi:hypothetical protein
MPITGSIAAKTIARNPSEPKRRTARTTPTTPSPMPAIYVVA